jgi:hypothetical protein
MLCSLAIIGFLGGLISLSLDLFKYISKPIVVTKQSCSQVPPMTPMQQVYPESTRKWYDYRYWVAWQQMEPRRRSAGSAGPSASSIAHDATACMDGRNDLSSHSGSGKRKNRKTKKKKR